MFRHTFYKLIIALAIIFSSMMVSRVLAQQSVVDSLRQQLKGLDESKARVDVLIELTERLYYLGQKDEASQTLTEAEDLSQSLGYNSGLVKVLWKQADLSIDDNILVSKTLLFSALRLSQQSSDSLVLVGTLNELGYYYLYYVPEQVDSSRFYFERALECNDGRYKKDLIYSYRFLAAYFNQKGNHELALDYSNRAIELDSTNLYTLNGKAVILQRMGRSA